MNDMWVLSLLAIPIACLIFVLTVDNYYLRRRVKRLRAKLDEAKRICDEANQRYDVTLLGFDPIECEEYHLQGDCPLCGGE